MHPILLAVSQFFFYGFLGLLVEVLFTGFHSLIIQRNIRAMSTTYLWMHPIYGGGALLFNFLHGLSPFLPWLNAVLLVPLIFCIEFSTGYLYEKIFGRKLWDYGNAKWGVMGHIRLDFAGYWLAAALFFEYSNNAIGAALFKFLEVIIS